MRPSNEEMGIFTIPIVYEKIIDSLVQFGVVDVSDLPRHYLGALVSIGNSTDAFYYEKPVIVSTGFVLLTRNDKYIRLKQWPPLTNSTQRSTLLSQI